MKTPIELGQILKAARLEKNLELSDLSVKIGLPEHYLAALESGEHDRLPGRAYARIYYLNYARELNLDPDELMRSWPQPKQSSEPVPARRSRSAGRLARRASATWIVPNTWLAGLSR